MTQNVIDKEFDSSRYVFILNAHSSILIPKSFDCYEVKPNSRCVVFYLVT